MSGGLPAEPVPTSRKRSWERAPDLLVAALWACYAGLVLATGIRGGGYVRAGLFLFYTLAAVCFLRRRPVQRQGDLGQTLLALTATAAPLAMWPGGGGWSMPGSILQLCGLAGMVAALLSLGRSFGIAPADRGLASRGLYRLIRHPMYASETLFMIGFVVAHPASRNGAIVVILFGLQIARIILEERIIVGYPSYAAQVRWRLVPFIW